MGSSRYTNSASYAIINIGENNGKSNNKLQVYEYQRVSR